MAMIFTIDLIEGNSHIGVPVFSNSAKKENKNYMVFSQPKAPKKADEENISEQERKLRESKDPKSVDRVSIISLIAFSFKYCRGSKNWRSSSSKLGDLRGLSNRGRRQRQLEGV